jgi:MFS family permease
VLAVALTAQILVVLDISVVNTALPTIGRSLSLDSGQLPWLVTAYLMMSGGGLLLGGRIADLMSRRTVFPDRPGHVHDGVLVSGFATSGTQLIAARAAQGAAAALLTPSGSLTGDDDLHR